jgi:UDP-glucuronate 4-epimerase
MGRVLITGAAGFIGYHLCARLLDRGDRVVGLDNLNDYYDAKLKTSRLAQLQGNNNFTFHKMDIADREAMSELFSGKRFDIAVNVAAQAGVRYSLVNPHVYIESNITGFLNVLEGCRRGKVSHLVFASSSSVYGSNATLPFSVHHNVDHPVSLYAATKKSNELMAHSYASLYDLPCTGLRFFTVYGPWGRPDMAYFLFTKAIAEDRPIDVFNYGMMMRDFTYIDDIIEGVVRVMDAIPRPNPNWNRYSPDPAASYAPYRLYNIGNNSAIELKRFIEILEDCIGKKAKLRMLPMQPGDVPATYADVDDLARDVGFKPHTPLEKGLRTFVQWYREFYDVPDYTKRPRRNMLATSGGNHDYQIR